MILINLTMIFGMSGQTKNEVDFFELSTRTGKLIESNFLENSKYSDHLSDPKTNDFGFAPYSGGRTFGVNFKYGKSLTPKLHIIGELGLVQRNEQVECFCHVCGKFAKPYTLVKLNSFDFGVGTRYKLVSTGKISFLIEGIGRYSIIISEDGIGYIGYSILPILQYKFTSKCSINVKTGLEQSFGNYSKKELYIGMGINYMLKK